MPRCPAAENAPIALRTDPLRATIISTGEELVSGRTADTNASFLAAELGRSGFDVRRLLALGDDPGALKGEILRCAQDSSVIAISGGLGPTADDRTRQAIAEAVGADLVEDADSRQHVARRLHGFGREVNEHHLAQAFFPAGSTIFPNPRGTARGFACRLADGWLVAMPGVPGEMKAMFAESVLPFLLREVPPVGAMAVETVNLFPASESEVDERVRDLSAADRNPVLGITVRDGVISVSVRACGSDEARAQELVDRDLRTLDERFGRLVFGRGRATLASALSEQLERTGITIGVAESVTGGLVGDMLVSVPGISRFLLADVVAYDNDAKVHLLGAPTWEIEAHGAVSPQVAESMARGICSAAGSRLGVSTTGIAGPTGGTPQKPVGLVYVGVCLDGEAAVARLELRGDRQRVRDRAAKHALDMARLTLLDGLDSLRASPYNVQRRR